MFYAPERLPVLLSGLLLCSLVGTGCSSTPKEYRDPRDPFQPFNRAVFHFNTDFDNAFLKPAARGYQAITPEPVNRSISNFFRNLADVPSAVNNALQFKLSRAGSDVGRVLINTTVGIGGLFDVATNMGLPSYKEDLGQTLGYWGVGPGPFLMVPVLGPSSVRDGIGDIGDAFIHPLFHLDSNETVAGLLALRLVDRRADLLAAGEILDAAAIDRYAFLRDAYLQRRRALVYDGNPPDDDLFGDDLFDDDWE
ncbi:MAG: VacJ family lipoprotein [Chromatiaceae bacterium]|nr:MAG: VacJ family lipoprotein [Chromatiaceae bacterium]